MCQAWKRCFLECTSYPLRKYLGHWGYFWVWAPAYLLKWRYGVTGTVWHWRLCTHYKRWPSDFQGVTINLQVASWSPFLLCQCPLPPVLLLRPHAPVTAAESHSSLFLPSLPSKRFSFFVSSPVTSSPFLGFWIKKLVNVILCVFTMNWSLGYRFKSLGAGLSHYGALPGPWWAFSRNLVTEVVACNFGPLAFCGHVYTWLSTQGLFLPPKR